MNPPEFVNWGRNDLLKYDITITSLPPQQFFMEANPSLAGINQALITAPLDATNVSDDVYIFFTYLRFATSQKAAVIDFAREFLHMSGFIGRELSFRSYYVISIATLTKTNNAVVQTDGCLTDDRSVIFLILLGDTMLSDSDPEPQVIAAAVAGYQSNNARRIQPLKSMTFPCIVMSGTRPTFYLVPVTEALSHAVITGRRARFETKVLKCTTDEGANNESGEGMEIPEYREVAFERMVAFKALAEKKWKKIRILDA